MAIVLTSDDAIRKAIAKMCAAARDPGPWARKVREFLLRETQRKAPRRRGGLRKSLNAERSTGTTIIISSDKPYARIQSEGGTIRAGAGPLKSKLLAIPLNEEARRMIGGMGTHESLRDQELTLIKSRRGRLLLIRQTKKPKRGRRRSPRRGRRRQHVFGRMQVMFVLVPRVKIRANPPPGGYVPRLDDPRVRSFIVRAARRHVIKGKA